MWLEVREITPDNLGGPDLISWKAFCALEVSLKKKKAYLYVGTLPRTQELQLFLPGGLLLPSYLPWSRRPIPCNPSFYTYLSLALFLSNKLWLITLFPGTTSDFYCDMDFYWNSVSNPSPLIHPSYPTREFILKHKSNVSRFQFWDSLIIIMIGSHQGQCLEDRTLWLTGLRKLVSAARWWLKVLITPTFSWIPEKGHELPMISFTGAL